ncbi:MAG: AI-2E family transporter [Gammaproteobacteria bacterium]|nr:AI-2E family transporter [Gammaproteobacteria bacterium]
MNSSVSSSLSRVSYILMGVGLSFVLWQKLLPALLAGLLIHELVYLIAPWIMQRARIQRRAAKVAVVSFLTVVVIALLAGMLTGLVYFFRTGNENLPALLNKMAEILDTSRRHVPQWLAIKIPSDLETIKTFISDWLRSHASEFSAITKTLRVLAQIIIGMIIGAMVSLHEAKAGSEKGSLTRALAERVTRLALAFRQVVFAQVRIAGLNTIFTAIYLMVVLPLFGVKLPFIVMMVVLTFIFGMLPVVGNIMSNTVIVIVSLNNSPYIAFSSLAFLIGIHKLEYFLNAKIIGARIQARAFEILLTMLSLEVMFGVAGVIAAPIYYAYLKKELQHAGLV